MPEPLTRSDYDYILEASIYARYAHEYDELEKFWDSFEQDKLAPYIAEAAGKEVLDAGAGTGRISLRLHEAGAKVTALDISSEMLGLLSQKNSEIEVVEGALERVFVDLERNLRDLELPGPLARRLTTSVRDSRRRASDLLLRLEQIASKLSTSTTVRLAS